MGTAEASAVDVSVLVPVRDEAAGIRDAVLAMRSQTSNRQLEFLYMDGGSQDGTREALEELARVDPRIRVLDNPHGGIPQALNIGLAHARGRFIARMDAHTLYPATYLETGVRWLERGDADWVAGPQLAHGVDRWSRRIAHAFHSPLGIGAASFRRAGGTAAFETDTGFTGIWRAETLKRLNGWDERWAINEDAELAARLREGGGRIVCVPAMAARWIPRRSLPGLIRQYWRYGQYREKTCLHHPESIRPLAATPARACAGDAGGRASSSSGERLPTCALDVRARGGGRERPSGQARRSTWRGSDPPAGLRLNAPGLGSRLPHGLRPLRRSRERDPRRTYRAAPRC